MNEPSEQVEKRRELFCDNLFKLSSHFTSSSGQNATEFIHLIPSDRKLNNFGSLLDLAKVPDECKKSNDDRLYLDTGIVRRRLAVRRINDTYHLRLTSYVSSQEGEQTDKTFANLSEHIVNLTTELGQTVILAGIVPTTKDSRKVAATWISHYYGCSIEASDLIEDEFLGSPFFIYPCSTTANQFNNYQINSVNLVCAFLYKDIATESQADPVYAIFKDMLLSYHKIHFFFSQSLVLKQKLSEQYAAIERLTENYDSKKWDGQSLKQFPKTSLEYCKTLSFLEDQEKSVRVNLKNYRECIHQIHSKVKQKVPAFFTDFAEEAENYHLEQIKASVNFLAPGIQILDRLMLSVQTQVGIENEEIQRQQNILYAQLGQILTGGGVSIALAQIITPPLISTIDRQFNKNDLDTAIRSQWLGSAASILISIGIGYILSVQVYRWLSKKWS